mmetsp:Transcript_19890/g.39019  ORF Transcript_19890/g.39019 Transcript_19890/m.39019 type:complete len:642 (-) Transcript_19890:34-1959(-)|eukprot:CAMPEP_0171511362 /NCGR_PEP_ID=MMETSP0959-20130129/946_1 /TAXON_ID=87120 /ORGANISM="Aurantiochytrium limacinum, Strain ATCCMYA-1381" /LENGTH=641 /DNA_ID=CAMNT_0012048967 /DNA_START=181 /DNA_END=2106 /DNA_ORIENTATION=-
MALAEQEEGAVKITPTEVQDSSTTQRLKTSDMNKVLGTISNNSEQVNGKGFPAKRSLHSQYPRWHGAVSLCFLLGNVGLTIYSHLGTSLVVLSNINIYEETLFSGVSACSTNDTEFSAWWLAEGSTTVYDDMIACASDYFLATDDETEALETCLRSAEIGYQGGNQCILCYGDYLTCAGADSSEGGCYDDCFLAALGLGGQAAQIECIECTVTNCNPSFEECTGFTMPDPPDDLTASRRLVSDPPEELYVVYNVSFVQTVRDSWNSGAYGVAVILTILSGIWPYLKNCIMFVAWFVPMRDFHRAVLLKNLTRFAKWSLIDVFVVIIILAGLRIDLDGVLVPRVYLVAESRAGIYAFCTAALWDLVQGEWMHLRHLRVTEQQLQKPTMEPLFSDEHTSVVQEVMRSSQHAQLSKVVQFLHILLSTVHIALFICTLSLPGVDFTLDGNAFGTFFANNPGTYESYRLSEIAPTLLTKDHRATAGSLAGVAYLVVVSVLCMTIVYIITSIIYPLALNLPWSGPLSSCSSSGTKRLCEMAALLKGFAAFDVFMLALVVTLTEWDRFVNSAMSELTAKFIGCVDPCIEAEAQMKSGLFIGIAVVCVGWLLELIFTYFMAEQFHPVEQNMCGATMFKLIGKCLPKSSN